jgi:ribosome assembly protein 4
MAALSSSVFAKNDSSSLTWTNTGLTGSTNPDAHTGYKRAASEMDEDANKYPSSVIVQFSSSRTTTEEDDVAANADSNIPAVDLPINSTLDQISAVVNSLLDAGDDNKTPYAFYLKSSATGESTEITSDLLSTIKSYNDGISLETTLTIVYEPLTVFRVTPVTRCSATMPGHTDAILHCTYSPNGKNLASGGGDTTVRFWDVNTSLPKRTMQGHKNHVLCTAWSPGGILFASGDKNGVLIIWDVALLAMKGSPIKAHNKYITSISWQPHHSSAGLNQLLTASKDGLIKIWNANTRTCVVTMSGHADSIECCKWGGEGFIYSASRDRTIKVWGADDDAAAGTRAGTLVRTLTGHGHRVNTLALSSDYACRTGVFDHNGRSTSADVGDAEANFAAAKARYEAAVTSKGPERLVSGSDDFTLFFWHASTSKHPVKRLTGHQQAVNHICFSPDSRYFASASFDKKVKIWDGVTGNFLHTLTGHVAAVYCVAWSSDSRFLVSASKDSCLKLWNVEKKEKKAVETLPGHEDEVYALDWSPDGRAVCSGSKDRTVKIWKH